MRKWRLRVQIPEGRRTNEIRWLEIEPGDRGFYLFQYEDIARPCKWDGFYQTMDDALTDAREGWGIELDDWTEMVADANSGAEDDRAQARVLRPALGPPMKELRETALLWIPAARSGFAKSEEWSAWADQHILALDRPPVWLLDVCVAKDADALVQALLHEFIRLVDSDPAPFLGFAWLRYELLGEELEVVLGDAGDIADSWGAGDPSCEDVYCARRLLLRCRTPQRRRWVTAIAEALFARCREVAIEQWERLHPAGERG